ncbi:MAG: 3-phosphoglycerate dehydrogenase [Proteobacteria bacterium]|nr:3-phosphoglycerate dehydrogenase [Pseudomonadota bacterium]
MRILISDPLAQEGVVILQEAGFEVDVKTGLSPEERRAIIGEYDGMIIRSATKVTADLLDAATKLKVIARAGTGLDNVDIPAATERGVVVMNTPGQNSNAAAELAVGMLFALSRHVPRGTAGLKSGKWEKKKLRGRELKGKTLGVVGLGNIGAIVAELGRGIKMKVLGYDPYLSDDQIKDRGAEPVSFDEMLLRADYVTIHIPRTEETANLFNAETLNQMKDGAYLVNCARGGLVDEEALCDALEAGKLAGAALDVFGTEPPAENHRLLFRDELVCTPHLGASTEEAQINVAVAAAEQIVKYLQQGEAVNAVNAPK